MVDYFKAALNGRGGVFAANSILTHSLKHADDYIISPSIYDEGYISFLLEYCKKKSIDVMLSLFDIDLPVLSKNKNKFEEIGVKVIVSSENAVNICNDKWKTFQFLLDIGLKQPNTYIFLEECKRALSTGEIDFPLMLKPRWGMGSIGIFDVDSMEELDVLYKKLHKIIFRTYLRFESNQNSDASILIQQKILGEEFGLDIFNDLHGKYATMVAKKKVALRAGETDIAQIVDSSSFLPVGKAVSESLRHIGNLDVDCFVTPDNDIYVLEMNCRFGGQYPFSHLAGVDFPAQIIKWCDNGDADEGFLNVRNMILAVKDLVPVLM